MNVVTWRDSFAEDDNKFLEVPSYIKATCCETQTKKTAVIQGTAKTKLYKLKRSNIKVGTMKLKKNSFLIIYIFSSAWFSASYVFETKKTK